MPWRIPSSKSSPSGSATSIKRAPCGINACRMWSRQELDIHKGSYITRFHDTQGIFDVLHTLYDLDNKEWYEFWLHLCHTAKLLAPGLFLVGELCQPIMPHRPERLGLDDLTKLPVVRAVVPAIRINLHHSTARSTPEPCPRMHVEPPLPE